MATKRKTSLRGNQLATVDEQGRLKIPTKFKDILVKEYGYEYFITSLTGEYVLMYPLTVWEAQIEERLTKTAHLNPRRTKLLDVVNFYGADVTMDKQGRISIPTTARNSAAIQGEVCVLGKIDHLDIWNVSQFENKRITGPDRLTEDDLLQLFAE
jgi:transcriptional regulator MraZ